ncbi:MAG: phosphoadenylyl-sulfate reductase [Gammaproteobacteria bacterium]|nr:phosphoadenylyl-sulfate reductase [Gammaproteobacteria bacterium]
MAELSVKLLARVNISKGIIKRLVDQHNDVVFANSLGAEDMVLTDIIMKHFRKVVMFTLDTGRLPMETYDLMHQVEDFYQCKLKYYYPDAAEIEKFTYENGINAFYNSVEMRKECCRIRKVEPLKRALAGKDAWITGQRRSQSVTRANLDEIEYDEIYGLPKANPLADWDINEIWEYIKCLEIPYNTLHDHFYPSIGCAPCTRAITPGEDIRSGRWWWENPESKECGLHSSNID